MKDPYAPESETTALIKADTRTPAERELARLMADAGDGEQGFEPEAALRRIALKLIAAQPAPEQEPSPGGVLFAVEEAIRNGDCPFAIEIAFDAYESERKALAGIAAAPEKGQP